MRREFELTSSFALTLQIQRIMARSLRRRRFSVSAFMAQVSAACSITLLCSHTMSTPYLWSEGGHLAVIEKGKQLPELAPCSFAACDCSQLTATPCREHVPKVAELWDNFKLFRSQSQPLRIVFINSPGSPKTSGTPELTLR